MKMIPIIKLQRAICVLAFAKAIFLTTSCKTESYQLNKVTASQTAIDSTIVETLPINEFIAPYKAKVDAEMNEPLSYNPTALNKNDFAYNTPLGNLLAHIMREQAAGVYKSRTGKTIDVVLLNHGGIRAGLPAGPVTMRNAFEVMPFENEMLVATLTGPQAQEMVNYLAIAGRAHPIDGLQIVLKSDKSLKSALIQGRPIDIDASYNVLTSDYLHNGGDSMDFFKGTPATAIDYKIRNAMIDYLRKTDTLKTARDDRFMIDKN